MKTVNDCVLFSYAIAVIGDEIHILDLVKLKCFNTLNSAL